MNVVCPQCGVTNRVSEEKAASASPVCGKCKARLIPGAPGVPVTVEQNNFAERVLKVKQPVLLDLWGPSCPPCRRLAPLLDQLAAEMVGKVRVAKMNVEQNPAAAQRFQVRGIPTLILLREGKEISRVSGFLPLPELRAFVTQGLDQN